MRRTLYLTVWITAVLVSPLPVSAQVAALKIDDVTVPNTIVGTRSVEFMKAYNSGESEQVSKYLKSHMKESDLENLKQYEQGFASVYEQVGKLEVKKFKAESQYAATITTLSAKTGMWLDIRISFDSEQPHHQGKLQLVPGRPPSASDYKNWSNLADLLEIIRQETEVPAIAMAVVKDGRVVNSKVSGLREIGNENTKAELGDRFHIGSVAKSMTAVMLGKLVHEQKLTWETTIGDILTEVEMRDEYRAVTLQQLVNHRGGIQAYYDDREFDRSKFVDASLSPTQQRLALAADALLREPVNTPGTKFAYSNAGFVIAAAMAERVTSQPFEKLMETYVFQPIGMLAADTGWPATSKRLEQPRGHFDLGNQIRAQKIDEVDMGHFLVPAGDIHCSITDLANYAIFHLKGLTSQDEVFGDLVKQLHRAPDGSSYAAGWMIGQAPDGSAQHFHNGSLVSFYAAIFLYPKHNAAIVVATNLGMGVETEIITAVNAVFEKQVLQQD